MGDWLVTQAQSASPFVATFLLAAVAVMVKVIVSLWNQLLSERNDTKALALAQIESNNAIVSMIESSKSASAVQMEQLKALIAQRR